MAKKAKKSGPKKKSAVSEKKSKVEKTSAKKSQSSTQKPVKETRKMTKAAQLPVKQEEILITKEGLEAIKVELDNLKNVRRKEVAQRLKEAISYGDLSENAEYEEARNEQAFVEGRILVLDQQIKHAKIISGTKKHVKVIQVGHTVVLRNKANSQKEQYIIVGSTEADPLKGKISNESPVGKSILGKGIGEKVTLAVPEGRASYEILKID